MLSRRSSCRANSTAVLEISRSSLRPNRSCTCSSICRADGLHMVPQMAPAYSITGRTSVLNKVVQLQGRVPRDTVDQLLHSAQGFATDAVDVRIPAALASLAHLHTQVLVLIRDMERTVAQRKHTLHRLLGTHNNVRFARLGVEAEVPLSSIG